MLEKFVLLKNIGRFINLLPKGDVLLRKLTLIYGENGRGKTTLCSVLRSLQKNDNSVVEERKTIGCSDSIECDIRIEGSNYRYSNSMWDKKYDNFAIFDSVFVHENIYAGDTVEHGHKKNLYRVIIGKKGVEYSRKADELNTKIKGLNLTIQLKKSILEKYIPPILSLDEFISLKPIDNIIDKIKESESELEKKQALVKKAQTIREKKEFSLFLLPDLPVDFESILTKSFVAIDEDAGEKVNKHITKKMASPNENWISQGMSLVTGESCPFCSQNIKDNEIISSYRTYFNKEYNQLKINVANLKKRINEAIALAKLLPVQKVLSDNLNLLEFWKVYIEKAELPEISFEEIQNAYEKLLHDCLTLADKKQANPLDTITLDDEFEKKRNNIQELKKAVVQYNDTVKILNGKISSFKQSLPLEEDVSECKKKLIMLIIHEKRFEGNTVKAVESYNAVQEIKRKLEKEKGLAKDCLDKYCEEILSQYEDSINSYLSSFNTGFSITNSKHNYKGGTPSSQYELKINNTPVGLEQFKTSMSAGDRSALAFAFFLASLEHDTELENKIVVLDDPFTSLDRFRRECTAQLSQKLAEKAKQVIILSHDPQFLKLVCDRHSATEPKTLQLIKCSHGSVIMEWDITAELKSAYMKNYSTLLAFYRGRDGDETAVARSIRPFLEGLYRTRFPGHFAENEWLGDFIGKIRKSSYDSGLAHASQDLEEIDAINSYSKDFHHDQNSNADSVVINEDELHGFVSRTLALVGGS